MRIGICAYWFNRGQGVVARQLRSALDSLGHQTFVLARPTRASNIRPAFVDRFGVWDQPEITEASRYEIPPEEVVAWGRESGLDVAFFDQNYGFEAIAALRGAGVRTVGRFVWEQFSAEHVEPARRALDVVYSLTACERERYAALGIESPRVRWGIHPELLAYAKVRQAHPATDPAAPGDAGAVPSGAATSVSDNSRAEEAAGGGPGEAAGGGLRFFYPAGFLSRRKPVKEVLQAFGRVDGDLSLVVKGQVERELGLLERAAARDPRVEVVLADLPFEDHMARFASADICLAPSRWEGLGLHLFESMALGLPVITNDNPPMNEVIRDGDNGLLVRARRRGRAKSGIPAYAPSVRGLAAAIERSREPGVLDKLRAGVERARERLSWERTVADYEALIARLR